MKAIFLDRDGTIIQEPPNERLTWIHDLKLFPDTIESLRKMQALGYLLIIFTNQAGISEGLISEDDFKRMEVEGLEAMLEREGIVIKGSYFCPHVDADNCECRKPKPKMILDAAKTYNIDLKLSYMIGDNEKDILAGKNSGTKTILVETGIHEVLKSTADYRAKNLTEAANYIAAQM
jgi:histidinol-phosphate phosphatase family protein